MFLPLLLAFLSGLVTISAPCIWPILPLILSSSTSGGKTKPLGVVLGTLTSFGVLTLSLSYIVRLIPIEGNFLRIIAAAIILLMGLSLIFSKLAEISEGILSRLSSRFAPKSSGEGFSNGFLTGLTFGVIWSPCAGPMMASVAALAATQSLNLSAIFVTIAYLLGVAIPLFLFLSFGRLLFSKFPFFSRYTRQVQQVFGLILVLTSLAIFTNYDTFIQVKLLNIFPSFDLRQKIESKALKRNSDLPVQESAPEFVGITNWLNLPEGKQTLSLAELKGKVVLVDFWTYTCINCIRTLPFVTGWYEKYKDKGFTVIGVHTPEFEFEKNTSNVKMAIAQYKINYPVAQDNSYATWNAYQNHYWPAEYLIDAQGKIRRTHFGEGEYEETEMAIKELIEEAGNSVDQQVLTQADQTPSGALTPETYLGLDRRARLTTTKPLSLNYWSLQGSWDEQAELISSKSGSSLEFNFYSQKVFLVITPNSSADTIKVLLDGKVIDETNAGSDVQNGFIQLDNARLYNLIDLKEGKGEHLLRLEFSEPLIKLYAFTFG